MLKNKASDSFGVIGLGRFGSALATTLAKAGKDVLVIDNNETKVKEMRQYTDNAYVSEILTKETLEQAGVQNCGTVIVCIGEKIDVSILTTLNVISLGVPLVISKAISYEQGAVLEKLGAEVVYPERDMALRIANKLLSNNFIEHISLTNDIDISEFKLSGKIIGQSVEKVNLRKRYGLNIIAIEHGNEAIIEISPNYVFCPDDMIVVIGKNENIKQFEAFLLN